MATVFPFRACLPKSGLASQVASLPYDVYTRAEAREAAAGNPLSFLNVTLADIMLGDEVSSYDPRVYELAAQTWRKFLAESVQPDARPSYYIYSQQMGDHRQYGIVGCVSVEEYNAGIVRKHERTRQEKEDDYKTQNHAHDKTQDPVYRTGEAFLIS